MALAAVRPRVRGFRDAILEPVEVHEEGLYFLTEVHAERFEVFDRVDGQGVLGYPFLPESGESVQWPSRLAERTPHVVDTFLEECE